jgi:hypothetical protein
MGVSWRGSDEKEGRTELELGSSQSLEDRHGAATLGTEPLGHRPRKGVVLVANPGEPVGSLPGFDAPHHFERMQIDYGDVPVRRAGHVDPRPVGLH